MMHAYFFKNFADGAGQICLAATLLTIIGENFLVTATPWAKTVKIFQIKLGLVFVSVMHRIIFGPFESPEMLILANDKQSIFMHA
jgi:hypothetical protein